MTIEKTHRNAVLIGCTSALLLVTGCDDAYAQRKEAEATKREVSATIFNGAIDVEKAKQQAALDVREAERTAEKNTADARVDASKAEAEALQNEQESGYQVLLNEAIANLENRIKLLKVKVQSRKGEARKTMDTAIVDLEARRLELETESNKLRTSSELDWEATKGRIEQLLDSSGKLLAAPFD